MKFAVFAILAGALAWPLEAFAGTCDSLPSACTASATDFNFTENKRECLEMLSACGRPQEMVDRIVIQQQAITPQEKYFLGLADFQLASRSGAKSIQCFYAVQSKQLLETFLDERQLLFRTKSTFGTADEMRYVAKATHVLGALRTIKGCEESSYTPAAIGRYSRSFAIDRIKGLFYESGAPDPLQSTFRDQLNSITGVINSFVSTASRLETRLGVTLAELDAGRRYLLDIQGKVNGLYAAPYPNGAVQVTTLPIGTGGIDAFPSFAYDARWQPQVLAELENGRQHFDFLLDPANEEGIAAIRQSILGATGALSEEDYIARKAAVIEDVHGLSTEVLRAGTLWLAVTGNLETVGTAPRLGKGLSDVEQALAQGGGAGLAVNAAALDARWSESMKGRFCPTGSKRWYCQVRGAR